MGPSGTIWGHHLGPDDDDDDNDDDEMIWDHMGPYGARGSLIGPSEAHAYHFPQASKRATHAHVQARIFLFF